MHINRIVVAGLICLLSWTLACVPSPAAAQAKKIAVIWEGKSAMTDAVALGFMSRIKKVAPEIDVKLYRNLKDMNEAENIYRDSEKTMDGIVFLRSSGAEFLAKEKPRIPSFVGGCNNPAELGAIRNLNAPEGMITGVTYFIPYEKRFQIIKSLFPGIKSVALLAEKGHPGTPIDQQGTQEQCKLLGIGYHEVIAGNLKELVDGAGNLAGKVDLFIISGTRLAMDNVVSLLPVANRTNTPMFSYADRPVKAGAVVGLAADDTKLGSMLADSVADVVVRGKPISQVPVKMDPAPKINVNKAMMSSLGLKFPDAILKEAVIIE
jgi:putative tryptophan/tyrosine transport system substrate-binding protein